MKNNYKHHNHKLTMSLYFYLPIEILTMILSYTGVNISICSFVSKLFRNISKQLKSMKIAKPISHPRLLRKLASQGQLNVLKWLRNKGYDHSNILLGAAESGHINVFKWRFDQKPTTGVDEKRCILQAVKYDRANILQYLALLALQYSVIDLLNIHLTKSMLYTICKSGNTKYLNARMQHILSENIFLYIPAIVESGDTKNYSFHNYCISSDSNKETCIGTALKLAIANGDLDMFKHILDTSKQFHDPRYTYTYYNTASINGQFHILDYIYENMKLTIDRSRRYTARPTARLIGPGSYERPLIIESTTPTEPMGLDGRSTMTLSHTVPTIGRYLYNIRTSGRLAVMKWHIIKDHNITFCITHIADNLDDDQIINLLAWLLDHGCTVGINFGFALAKKGYFKALLRLPELKQARILDHIKISENSYYYAAVYNNLDYFKFRYTPILEDPRLCNWAARHGNLKMLQWLRSQKEPCSWNGKVAQWAALYGRPHILKWLHENKGIIGIKVSTQAAITGHVSILDWLLKNKYPINRGICEVAARNSQMLVLDWGIKNGFYFDSSLLKTLSEQRDYYWPYHAVKYKDI